MNRLLAIAPILLLSLCACERFGEHRLDSDHHLVFDAVTDSVYINHASGVSTLVAEGPEDRITTIGSSGRWLAGSVESKRDNYFFLLNLDTGNVEKFCDHDALRSRTRETGLGPITLYNAQYFAPPNRRGLTLLAIVLVAICAIITQSIASPRTRRVSPCLPTHRRLMTAQLGFLLRSAPPDRCVNCDYDAGTNAVRCPECGEPPETLTPPHARRWHYIARATSALITACAAATLSTPCEQLVLLGPVCMLIAGTIAIALGSALGVSCTVRIRQRASEPNNVRAWSAALADGVLISLTATTLTMYLLRSTLW